VNDRSSQVDAAAIAPAGAAAAAPPGRSRKGRLFRKYLLLILTLVSGALLASGAISVYFSYQEQRSALGNLQQEKAIAAASRIEQYIRQIEQQLAYAALPQLDPGDVEQRRIEFLKLLRQVPEVTDITQLDGAGREQVAVSRLGMDVMASGKDRSQEPAFKSAKRNQPWVGPVYFRKETEPYMTVAVRSGSDAGPLTVAEVNLKFIWDVVSRIKIGDKGKAYVVDRNGFLVADPDIGLVLRKTNMSELPHVQAAASQQGFGDTAMVSRDLAGTQTLVSVAPIEALGWSVFVEQPVSEVYAKLNASILRTGLLLLAGLVISALGALALARGMVRPIRTLSEGAQRIGEGNLDQKIDVRTGDELEALADRFNTMSGQLRESYAGLERKVEERTSELKNSLEQQTAISEILRVISSSPTDVQPVVDAVAERAAHLCAAPFARVMLVDGDLLRPVAEHSGGVLRSDAQWEPTDPVPLQRTSITGRAAVDRKTIHYADVLPLLETEFAGAKQNMLRFGCRAVLAVPLMREGGAYGAIFLSRHEPGLFPADQVALVETFARQAAIAIDNVRLFNETKETLDQQTAISEILRVIASSPGDVRPMLKAVAERALNLCDASQSTIFLVEGGEFRFAAGFGSMSTPAENDHFPLSRGLVIGRAVIERETIHHSDIVPLLGTEYPDARANQQKHGFRALLAVPLMREDRAIGAIALWRMEARAFSAKQIALVKTFADQAAIAIENVRLFNETKEALEQQTAVAEILRAISSSPTDVKPVLDTIADRALHLCDAAAASIYLTDGNLLRHVASQGSSPEEIVALGEIPLRGDSTSGRAVLERRTIHVHDILAEADAYPLGAEISRRFGNRTMLVTPLYRKGQPFGTILLRRKDVRPFSEREIALLKTFGDQAAIAIENVRLFNETKEALEQQTATAEVLKAISRTTFELEPVLETLIENATRLCKADKGTMYLRRGDAFELVASQGASPEQIQFMRDRPVPPGSGTVVGRVAQAGQPVHVDDAQTDPSYTWSAAREIFGFRSMFGVPMLREGEPIGVVVTWRKEVRPFSERERQLVATFADQAVIAIENVRLFREIQDKSRELEVANKHKSEFLANMSHELRTPLNAIIGFSEVLLERLFGELNEKQDDYLKDIHLSGKHLLGLINDILDLSKVEAGRMELDPSTFDVSAAIANAMTLVRERAQQHGIALRQEVDPGVGEITADERKFKQILLNLLSNAVKFTPDGGRIDVKARRGGDEIVVAVHDTGIGIAPQDRDAVFEEFRQFGRDYTRKQEGTGLGLALTKRFVELHGGRVWLESELAKGSTFTFTIPVHP
jgi:signal transduction histidine kinase